MSELTEAIAAIGLPVVGLGTAGGMLKLSQIIEQAARPTAIAELGRKIVETPATALGYRRSIVPDIFVLTFGSRQLSWQCWRRSVLVSMAFATTLFCLLIPLGGAWMVRFVNLGNWLVFVAEALLWVAVFDYLALAKTRWLLNTFRRSRTAWVFIALPVLDIVMSVAIVWLALYIVGYFGSLVGDAINWAGAGEYCDVQARGADCMLIRTSSARLMVRLFPPSTMFTTAWIILTEVSVGLLQLLRTAEQLRRFAVWFLDVQSHPLQALAILAGAVVWAGTIVVALARWVV